MSIDTSTITTQKHYPPPVLEDEEIYYPPTDPNAMPETDIHFTLIANLVFILRHFFINREDANVFGDLMFYYEKGNRRKFVAPNVMVCFGLDKTPRKTYRLWEEKVVPTVIIEVASETTWLKDVGIKLALYQKLGVKEYYIYDAEFASLPEPLLAYRYDEGELVEVEVRDNRILSESLGLELVNTDKTLRLFNPETNEFLMTMEEIETIAEKNRRENTRLKAEIEKLKNQIKNQ